MKRTWLGVLALAATAAACGGDDGATMDEIRGNTDDAVAGDVVTLTGAGATFPYPIYSKWFSTYGDHHPVRVNYQPIGSGGGIRQITEKTVDFGASDAPMTEEEMAKIPGVLHLPTVLGAVAVTYNLPGVSQSLKLIPDVLADIFTGTITRWNDPRIAQLNPGVNLPAKDILVVTRTDGSGTTYVFTDYLAAVNPQFQQKVGVGKSVKWPTGLGAKGNEGVAGQIRQTEGAVGYVELAYARQNDLAVAALRNQAGTFVEPSVAATTAAAAGVADRLDANSDFRMSLVNAAGPQAYPISTWTYLLLPGHFEDCSKARALADVVRWSVTEGGAAAEELDYAPLPENVRTRVLDRLNTVTCGPNRQPISAAS